MSRVRELGAAATRALLRELDTTPKPGLVDRNGNGAHRDLSYDRLESSALALELIFVEIANAAAGERPTLGLREYLGDIGRRGERVMLAASGGSNTHRGAIWALGLLVAGAATAGKRNADHIAARAGEFARLHDRFAPVTASNGRVASTRYHVDGARGEAASGFPHVVRIGLPALRAGYPLPDVFLRLVATVEDTCVLHRGGRAAQDVARSGARKALRAGGSGTLAGLASIRDLERGLLAHNASPGGCADMLAATLLLHDLAE
jgi:triphosphoribosyl-dephospho-CoA synthase